MEGNLRVLTGENTNLNGGFQLTNDLYVVGTPAVTVNGGASHGGIVSDGGAATPNNYAVTLNGGYTMTGKIHRQADAVALPTDIPTSVPAAAGTRVVNINNASDVNNIGAWATLKDLNVNVANLVINVPPGNYGAFILNGGSRLNFTAGTYNFANTVTLNGNAVAQLTGDHAGPCARPATGGAAASCRAAG